MHSLCRCSRQCHLVHTKASLFRNGSAILTPKRFYAAENPKWTSQAEEQFGALFKVKEKPPPSPPQQAPVTARPSSSGPKTKINTMPPPQHDDTLVAHIERPTLQTPSFRRPPPMSSQTTIPTQAPSLATPTTKTAPLTPTSPIPEEIPGIPAFGDQYAGYARMGPSETRPTKPFSALEAEERAPELVDEKDSIVKLWLENLPVTEETVVQEALQLLVEHPLSVSGLEVVTERGMIATKSAFVTVNFGINDREKIFYKLENFGLTIKGMRCPVRTAEVKRTLTLIELGQISEEALVTALRDHDIRYQTYDYPGRYNSPQRQIAFPYRGSVILTFRSHHEAYVMKRRFDSDDGVMIGEKRIYAMWGPRAGSMPLEIRTSANYMRNLIWENRDLRKYVSNARQANVNWKEPQGFNALTDMFEKQHKQDFERQAALDEIKQQLEDTRRALKRVISKKGISEEEENDEEESEVVEEATEILEKAKDLEIDLQKETIMGRVQAKTVLDELGSTRSISPFVPRIEDNMGLSQIEEEFDKSFASLKAKHDAEFKRLKEVHSNARKKVVQEVFAKNHRNVGQTAEELGVSRARISKDTRLKPKKKTKKRVKKAKSEDGVAVDGEGEVEGEGVVASGENAEAETEGGQAETEGGEAETESGSAETESGSAEAETESGEVETERGEAIENEHKSEDSEIVDSKGKKKKEIDE